MNTQRIKSIFFFLLATAVFFYAAHNLAFEKKVDLTADQAQSTAFLETVDSLKAIAFDFEFINTLGRAKLLTGGYSADDIPPTGAGRYNPFIKSGSSQSAFSGVVSNFGGLRESSEPAEPVEDVPVGASLTR